jgi:hypothetical protein
MTEDLETITITILNQVFRFSSKRTLNFSYSISWQGFINHGLQLSVQLILVFGFIKLHCAVALGCLKNHNMYIC